MTHIVALLASHNRKDATVACLETLFGQVCEGVEIRAVLVDDGSTDGTSDAVQSHFGDHADIVRGDGTLYWARSMALAEEHAVARRPDFILWLNDDVLLFAGALTSLFAGEGADEPRIVVGYTIDPSTGVPTYGGASRIDWHPLRYRLVAPTDGCVEKCDTFNGNVVLIPRAIYEAVGGIDGQFAHGFADFDYGLRARRLGFEIVVAPTPVGECRREIVDPTWRDASLSLVARYRLMLARKGVPISSSARYLRRHGHKLWPIYLIATYAKVAAYHASTRIARDHGTGSTAEHATPSLDSHDGRAQEPVQRAQRAPDHREIDFLGGPPRS